MGRSHRGKSDAWHLDGYESARARVCTTQWSIEALQLVGNTIRAHDSTAMCTDREAWAYTCMSETCQPCNFSALNLCGVVKCYGAGLTGQLFLIHGPFLDPAARRELLNQSGGVIEPQWLDLGLLSQEDQGEKKDLRILTSNDPK